MSSRGLSTRLWEKTWVWVLTLSLSNCKMKYFSRNLALFILNLFTYKYLNSFFFFKYLFIYLAAPGFSCGIQDLVPWPGIEPRPSALGVCSLNHWTTGEVPLIKMSIISLLIFSLRVKWNDTCEIVFKYKCHIKIEFHCYQVFENSSSRLKQTCHCVYNKGITIK